MYVRILDTDGNVKGRVKASDVYAYLKPNAEASYVTIYLAYSSKPVRSHEPLEKFEYALFNAMGDNE